MRSGSEGVQDGMGKAEMKRRMRWIVIVLSMVALASSGQALLAQAGGGPLMGLGLLGKWWDRPMLVRQLGLTPEQQAKMDEILQQHRLRLVDLRANLQKAEIELEPLVASDDPNDGQIMAGVSKVAEARAQLEEENARLLLDVRHQLTPQQWKQIREMIAQRRERMQQQRMNGMRGQANNMGAGMQSGADGSPDQANLPPVPKGGNAPQQ